MGFRETCQVRDTHVLFSIFQQNFPNIKTNTLFYVYFLHYIYAKQEIIPNISILYYGKCHSKHRRGLCR